MSNQGSLPKITYLSPATRAEAGRKASGRTDGGAARRSADADRFDQILRTARRSESINRPESDRGDHEQRLRADDAATTTDTDHRRSVTPADNRRPDRTKPATEQAATDSVDGKDPDAETGGPERADRARGGPPPSSVDEHSIAEDGLAEPTAPGPGSPSGASEDGPDVEGQLDVGQPASGRIDRADPAPAAPMTIDDEVSPGEAIPGQVTAGEVTTGETDAGQVSAAEVTADSASGAETAAAESIAPDTSEVEPANGADETSPIDRVPDSEASAPTIASNSRRPDRSSGDLDDFESDGQPEMDGDSARAETIEPPAPVPDIEAEVQTPDRPADSSQEEMLSTPARPRTEGSRPDPASSSTQASGQSMSPPAPVTGIEAGTEETGPRSAAESSTDAVSSVAGAPTTDTAAGPGGSGVAAPAGPGSGAAVEQTAPAGDTGTAGGEPAADAGPEQTLLPAESIGTTGSPTAGNAEPTIATPVSAVGTTVSPASTQTLGQLTAAEATGAGFEASALAPNQQADGSDPLWQQVRRALGSVRNLPSGEQQLTIRLRPAELGSVVVRINTGENGTSVSLVTESSAASNQLNQQRQQLLTDLEDSGLSDVSVDINAGSDGDRAQTDQSDPDGGATGAAALSGRGRSSTGDGDLIRGYGRRRDRGPSVGLVDMDL